MLIILRVVLRIVVVVLSICIFPSRYYFSLDIRRKRHIPKDEVLPSWVKYRLSYITIREKKRKYQRLWSDVDTRNVFVIESIRKLFSDSRDAVIFPTMSGCHVISKDIYPLWERKTRLMKSVKLGASKNHAIHQIGEEKYYSAGCRVSSKYVTTDGYILIDICPSTQWHMSDPFPIHLMNVMIRINYYICFCINYIFGGML